MLKMHQRPRFAGTMMGAVPYRDMDWAADTILECFPEAPCLPIMTRGIRWMLEGYPLPGVRPGKTNRLFRSVNRKRRGNFGVL